MSALSSRIALRESMRHEENVRVNADREQLRTLAPIAWEQFKQAFWDECNSINEQSQLTTLECVEPDEFSLDVNVVRAYTPSVGALSFKFAPSANQIIWQDFQHKKTHRVITLMFDNGNVRFVEDGKGLILTRFVEQRLDAITR